MHHLPPWFEFWVAGRWSQRLRLVRREQPRASEVRSIGVQRLAERAIEQALVHAAQNHSGVVIRRSRLRRCRSRHLLDEFRLSALDFGLRG
jgi:hypothetical protein